MSFFQNTVQWKLETDVNDWVQKSLEILWLQKRIDFGDESTMSEYMKTALQGWAKTHTKTAFGRPDFHLEKFTIKNTTIPVIIENKLWLKKLIAWNVENMKFDAASKQNYAVNGALHYAQHMIESKQYNEVIAIGVAGDNAENVKIMVFYVTENTSDGFKYLPNISHFSFLKNQTAFADFYRENCLLSEKEKHEILIKNKTDLQKDAKELNTLMHHHNITASQRVLYISWMLLSMQTVEKDGNILVKWLTIDNLRWVSHDTGRDGMVIISQIQEFLEIRDIPHDKRKLMMASFSEISKDEQRDREIELHKSVAKFLPEKASINKQIFTFIYKKIFEKIENFKRWYVDVMGEMYSEFLKYALGDGKELWIVLTPPYITKLMTELLDINPNSKVMDLATGSAGFLIAAMEEMISQVETQCGKFTEQAESKIHQIKTKQLLGVELNAEMFTLAATNMILRGDGSSHIIKWDSFKEPPHIYQNFWANKLLLNPPFSFVENGMPFIEFWLQNMEKWGLGAIIIQDSAGSGQAVATNQKILKNHTLIASLKMPVDLFQPMAWVQTSIYILEAKKPHDFEKTVKFIDFRNDGYKRTSRSLQEIDKPLERYSDIVKIFKAGKNAQNLQAQWNLDEIYIEDFITDSGKDWNFEQHQKYDSRPTLDDFRKTVSDYLAWEVSQILQNNSDSLGK